MISRITNEGVVRVKQGREKVSIRVFFKVTVGTIGISTILGLLNMYRILPRIFQRTGS